MELIFASNNHGKLQEVQALLASTFRLSTLRDEGILESIPEPYFTFRENAFAKANYVFELKNKPCFAEDSGLVVPALNNEPGVLSSRYAGEPSNDEANNEKLLGNIRYVDDRTAYYHSVICFILNKEEVYYFEGKCYGTITLNPTGNGGFGYDPLFVPKGYSKTFAEFEMSVKNKISHRGEAVRRLAAFLNTTFTVH